MEDSLLIILDLIIGDSKGVIKAVFFHVLIDGSFDPSNRLLYLRFIIVRQPNVVAKDILSNFVRLRLLQYLLISVLEVIEDISQIFIGSLVLIISFHSSEVPFFCLFIPFQKLIVDSDVVIARAVLGIDLCAFCVPFYSLFVHLLDSAIADAYLIAYSCVFWV